jgi:sterol desaturase/sphingolipid hydroxylase (fatty acid hydroxylase superfamily)
MLTYWEKLGWSDILMSPFLGALKLILVPGSRTYWPYLFVSLLLGYIVWHHEKRLRLRLPNHLNLFSRDTWLSRSAINDYLLITVNMAIFSLLLNAFVVHAPRWIATGAQWLPVMGATQISSIPQWAIALLLAASLFVVDDFLRFLVHLLEHRVKWLWELHKVHHSATVMNFVTAERQHPVSIFLTSNVLVFGAIAVNLLFLALFADEVKPAYWLGANVFWVCANFLASSLRHSPAWLSFGPKVERWLISPAQHQIHHSENPTHYDKNYGSTLAIWDRLFGSLYLTTSKREFLTFGLGDDNSQFTSLRQLFFVPMKRILKLKGQ